MAGKGKTVALTPEAQELWAEENKRYGEQMKALCAPDDAAAGEYPYWPHNFRVKAWVETNSARIEREYIINAGSQQEACEFAKRRIRGEARRDGLWVKDDTKYSRSSGIVSLVNLPETGEPEPNF